MYEYHPAGSALVDEPGDNAICRSIQRLDLEAGEASYYRLILARSGRRRVDYSEREMVGQDHLAIVYTQGTVGHCSLDE
jgi:hypothetical protein